MEIKIAYMCAVDYEYHLENDWNGAEVYPSIKSLKEHRPCVKGCGIVKIQIIKVKRK